MTDIFISYASADRPRVKPLVDALQQQGWSVWWDRTILAGKTFDRVIEAALRGSRCVIVLWSQDSIESDWVWTEADEGKQRRILVPAVLDNVVIPFAFRRIQTANLVGWSGALPSDQFDELARAVSDVLSSSDTWAPDARSKQEAKQSTELAQQERDHKQDESDKSTLRRTESERPELEKLVRARVAEQERLENERKARADQEQLEQKAKGRMAPLLVTETTPPLSEGARIVNTFVAPSKTFTDLRRSVAWWAPFLLMAIVSTIFVYTAGHKIGFRQIVENQIQTQTKQQARLDLLTPDQREQQIEKVTKFNEWFFYFSPLYTLFVWLIVAMAFFVTFKFVAGANVSFGISLAIVVYAALPLMLRTLLATLSVLGGINTDSFSFQNPVPTNLGYFMNPTDGVFLYGWATAVDAFMIWTLALTAIGFTRVSEVKRGTAFAIVFGWWVVLTLGTTGLGAAFS